MSNNTDRQEIAKFDALGGHWWNRNGEFKSLHDINPLRLDFIERHIDLSGKKLIDVGCGGGILSEALAKQGAIVSAIDMSEAAIESARLHLHQSQLSIDYQVIPIANKAETDAAQYDCVTCMELLEHVPDPSAVVKACARLLKPGGKAFFSTLNRNPKAYLLAIIGAEYLLKMIPKGTHDYSKFIRPSELDQWAHSHGLHLLDMKGLQYNPISKRYWLNQDVSVNYMVCYTNE